MEKKMMTTQGILDIHKDIVDFFNTNLAQKNLLKKQLKQFIRELNQFIYKYLAEQKLNFDDIFDFNEFEVMEKNAYIFADKSLDFINFVFQTLHVNLEYNQNHESVIEYVKEYINRNLDKELSRSLLAKEVYLSEDYISKLFKNKVGMSLPNYIAMKRIEKAKEYLIYSDLSVSKIALEVGFNNFSYFSKIFKDYTGMTPNEYKSNKKQK